MIFSGQWLRLRLGFVSRTGTCRFRIETHVHHRSDDFASVHAESSHHFVSGPGSQLWYRDPTTMGTRLTTQIIRSLFGVTKTILDGNFASPVFVVSFPLFLPLCSLVSLHRLYSSLVSFFTCSSLVIVCCLFHFFFVFVFLHIIIFIFHIHWCSTRLATVTCSTRHTSPHRAIQDTALMMSTSTNKQRHRFRCKDQHMCRTIKPSKQRKTKRTETIERTHGVAAYFPKDGAKTEPHINTH